MSGNRRIVTSFALWTLIVAAGMGPDDGQRPQGASVPSDPTFEALLADGSTITGQIRRVGEKEGIVLTSEDGQERPIPLDRLVKMTRGGPPSPSFSEGGEIILFPDGDRLAHSKIGQAGEFNVSVHSFSFEDLEIPLDSILGLIFNVPSDPVSTELLVARVRAEARESELLWLENGDKLSGLFAGLDDKKLAFQPVTGKIDVPREGVVALGFAQGQVVYRRPAGLFFELTTLDGSRWA